MVAATIARTCCIVDVCWHVLVLQICRFIRFVIAKSEQPCVLDIIELCVTRFEKHVNRLLGCAFCMAVLSEQTLGGIRGECCDFGG